MNLSEIQAASPLFNLVPLVVFLPALGMLLNLIFGRRMSEKRYRNFGQCGQRRCVCYFRDPGFCAFTTS